MLFRSNRSMQWHNNIPDVDNKPNCVVLSPVVSYGSGDRVIKSGINTCVVFIR